MTKRAIACLVVTILIMIFILCLLFMPMIASAEGFYGGVEVGHDVLKPFCNLTNDLTIGYSHIFGGIIGINLSAGIVTGVFNDDLEMAYWHPYLSTYRVRGEIIIPLFEDGFLVVGGLAKCSHRVDPGTWNIPSSVRSSWYYVPPTERVIYAAMRFGEWIR